MRNLGEIDQREFARLLRETLPRLRRYARALTSDTASADDLVQDTLERAWSRQRSYNVSLQIRPWLFGIMHNLFVDQIRKARIDFIEFELNDFELSSSITPESQLSDKQIISLLSKLPFDQREIISLVCIEDLSYAEVSKILGIPIGTVMSRLSRARIALRSIQLGPNKPDIESLVSMKVVK